MSDETPLEKLQAIYGSSFSTLSGVGTDETAEILQLFTAMKILNGVESINLDDMDATEDEKEDIRAKALGPSEAMAYLIYYFVKASLPPTEE